MDQKVPNEEIVFEDAGLSSLRKLCQTMHVVDERDEMKDKREILENLVLSERGTMER